MLGSRFFGAGNELEIALAAIGLLGLGGALATARPGRGSGGSRSAARVLAFTLGLGPAGRRRGRRADGDRRRDRRGARGGGRHRLAHAIAILLVAPVAGLAALALLDLVTGGDAHFSRSVLEAGGLDEIADIAERRVRLSYRSLGRGVIPFLVALALVALALGSATGARLLAPPRVRRGPGGRLRACWRPCWSAR